MLNKNAYISNKVSRPVFSRIPVGGKVLFPLPVPVTSAPYEANDTTLYALLYRLGV